MKNRFDTSFARAWLAAALLAVSAAAWAQTPSPQAGTAQAADPARWYQEDLTVEAQLRTLRKEISAALQQARTECRQRPAAERPDCLKTAQATYRADMANAKQLRDDAHH